MHQRRGVMAAIRGDGFTFAGCHEAAVVWLQVLPPTRGLTARASSGRAALVLRESFRQCLMEHIGVDNSRTRLGASWGLLLTRDLLLADLDVARVLLCGRLFLGSFLRGHLFLGGLFLGSFFLGHLFLGGLFAARFLAARLLGGLLLTGLLTCLLLGCHRWSRPLMRFYQPAMFAREAVAARSGSFFVDSAATIGHREGLSLTCESEHGTIGRSKIWTQRANLNRHGASKMTCEEMTCEAISVSTARGFAGGSASVVGNLGCEAECAVFVPKVFRQRWRLSSRYCLASPRPQQVNSAAV
jgi:hypothetical protein